MGIYRLTGEELELWKSVKNKNEFILSNGLKFSQSKVNLYKEDLSGLDLSNIILSGAYLMYVNFTGTNLNNAFLYYSNMGYSYFNNANLTGACLVYVDLKCANLTGTILKDTNIECADIHGVIPGDHIIRVYNFPEYKLYRIDDIFVAGGESHTIDEWKSFSKKEIINMLDKKGVDFFYNTMIHLLDI